MKKKFLLLPLLMLALASCDPVIDPTDSTSTDPTSSDTATDTGEDTGTDTGEDTGTDTGGDTTTDTSPPDEEPGELDPTELNAIFGFDVYDLLPPIYTEDYFLDDYPNATNPINVYIDVFDWEMADALNYLDELEVLYPYDSVTKSFTLDENLYSSVFSDDVSYDDLVFGVRVYTRAEEPVKEEIDPTELNTYFDLDVYVLIPKVYSNEYFIHDWNDGEGDEVDIYLYLLDWVIADAFDYMNLLDDVLDFDYSEESYIVNEDVYLYIFQDTVNFAPVTAYGLAFYTLGEPVEKDEIDPTELNDLAGFDLYALLPEIYSNEYEVSDWAGDNYPVDIYIDLYDWRGSDVDAYDALLADAFELDPIELSYVIQDNLYIYVADFYGAFINIYSIAEDDSVGTSPVWPGEVISEFFGHEVDVPVFESDNEFVYYIAGEDDYAQLIILTPCDSIEVEDDYVAALLAAGWIVDDSNYDYVGYAAYDPDEQISLLFYWWDGVMYFSFMVFYADA